MDMDMCEFMAQDELVEIIPNFRFPKPINLICGAVGPFLPSIPVRVPFWLALNLKKQMKCTITIPQWVSDLEKAAESQDEKGNLVDLGQEHWREIVRMLEECCELKPYCAGLIERREAILRTSAHNLFRHAFTSQSVLISDVSVLNVTPAELNLIKTITQVGFKHFQKMRMLYLKASTY